MGIYCLADLSLNRLTQKVNIFQDKSCCIIQSERFFKNCSQLFLFLSQEHNSETKIKVRSVAVNGQLGTP